MLSGNRIIKKCDRAEYVISKILDILNVEGIIDRIEDFTRIQPYLKENNHVCAT